MRRLYATNEYGLQRKCYFKKQFNGSNRLFEYCWKKMLQDLQYLGCIDSISDALEAYAGEAVNNPRSSFYIYGK